MTRTRGGRWASAAVLALAVVATATGEAPNRPTDPKAFDKLVVDTLRDVHNRGADLYNSAKDYAGAFRIYEGALQTVRPIVAYRPIAQKMIEDGLAAAEKEADPARRAFVLHDTIERVRAYLKTAAANDPVVVEPKKVPPPPPTDPVVPPKPKAKEPPAKTKERPAEVVVPKAKDPAPPQSKTPAGGASGTVTLGGKPVAHAEVMLVSLTLPKPRVFTATAKDDGSYEVVGDIPAGKYVVVVKGKGVPAIYETTTTSGLTVDVKAGARCDLALK